MGSRQSWDRWSGWRRLASTTSPWASSVATEQWFLAALVGISLLHLLLAGLLPPAEDELYYWTWSQHLRLSYYDHPPMGVAYLIRLSTTLFGDNLFGIRFFAVVTSFVVPFVLGHLTGTKSLLSWLLFTPSFFLGGVVMTPDVPLLLFWTLYLAWTVRTNRAYASWSLDPVTRVYHSSPVRLPRWIAGGVILGLGLLSKYPMALAIPCAFLLYATRYRWSSWLGGFAVHLLTAALVASPIWFFNRHYGFEPLLFQWHHANSGSPEFWKFIGTQILLVGAVPFFVLPWALLRARLLGQEPRLTACFWLSVPPLVFFVVKAMSSSLEANWPLIAYVGIWPIAQRLLDQSSFKGTMKTLAGAGFLIPVALNVVMFAHLVHPLPWLPPGQDRLTRFKSLYALSSRMADDITRMEEGTLPRARVFAPTYQWTSYLRYRHVPAEQLVPGGRQSTFTLDPVAICDQPAAIVLESAGHRPPVTDCFAGRRVMKEYRLVVREQEFGHWLIVRYTRDPREPSAFRHPTVRGKANRQAAAASRGARRKF